MNHDTYMPIYFTFYIFDISRPRELHIYFCRKVAVLLQRGNVLLFNVYLFLTS